MQWPKECHGFSTLTRDRVVNSKLSGQAVAKRYAARLTVVTSRLHLIDRAGVSSGVSSF